MVKLKRLTGLIPVILFAFLITACGRVANKAFNPYESEFACPQAEKGKCVGIKEAYQESLKQEKEEAIKEYSVVKEFEKESKKEANATSSYLRGELLLSPAEERYVESLYGTLTKLLKEPQTPVIVPPKIVRVLILPYQNSEGKNLYSARYVYVIVEEPKWILQNILTNQLSPEE